MGGTRFAHLADAVRVSRDEHDAIATRAIDGLAALGIEARIARALGSKTSFGDVDLICGRAGTHAGVPEIRSDEAARILAARDAEMAAAVGAIAHDRGGMNNPTLHTLVEGPHGPVQLDLMSVEDLDFVTRHYSFGDAGVIAATIARQMGVKMGMRGMRLVDNHQGRNLSAALPLDYDQVLALIGLDPERHRRGFAVDEEVYSWLAAGDYFDPRIWGEAWTTCKRRRRGAKRPQQVAFVPWLERERPPARYDWGPERGSRTAEWFERLSAMFPQSRAEIERQRNAVPKPTGVRAFFTGEAVTRATGVEGDALMRLMHRIRTTLGAETLERMAQAQDHAGLEEAARAIAAEIA